VLQITERLTDGTGDFDPEALLKKLPEDLALPEKKVANQMRTLAKDRRHTTLVQVPLPAGCLLPHVASLAHSRLFHFYPVFPTSHQVVMSTCCSVCWLLRLPRSLASDCPE
jgi:hypothetical protein